jgi:hypothetical protein
LDEEECEDRIVAQESKLLSCARFVVSCTEAVDSGFVEVVCEEEEEERILHTKASISSTTTEWIRRCMLLCLVPSNRYPGSPFSVARQAVQDWGRKMCTWCKLLFTTSRMAPFIAESTGFWRIEEKRSIMIEARRETLKCDNGSKRIIDAS